MEKLKKIAKKIFWILFISMTSMLILLVAGMFVFKNKIISYSIQKVNSELNTPINVEKVDIHIFKHFPNFTVRFENINIAGSAPLLRDSVLVAAKFDLVFNPLNIWRGNYQIEKIFLKNATILLADSGKYANYNILKTDTSASGKGFELNFKNITLENVRFIKKDKTNKSYIGTKIKRLELSGNFSSSKFSCHLFTELEATFLNEKGNSIVSGLPLKLETDAEIDKVNKQIIFAKNKLAFSEMDFEVNGNYFYGDKDAVSHIDIKASNLTIKKILEYLPENTIKLSKDVKTSGNINLHAQVSGKDFVENMPKIAIDFSLEKGTLAMNGEKLINEIYLKGNYSNGKNKDNKSSILDVKKLNCNIRNQPVSGRISIKNFEDPTVDAYLKGNINLETVYSLFQFEKVDKLEGNVIANLKFDGKWETLKNPNLKDNYELNGDLKIVNGHIQMKNSVFKFDQINADISFNKTEILMKNNFRVNDDSISVNGKVQNLIGYLFIPEQDISIVGKVKIKSLHLDNWLQNTKTENVPDKFAFSIPKHLRISSTLEVGNLYFKKFAAAKIIGIFNLFDNEISVSGINLQAFGGNIELEGLLKQKNATLYDIDLDLITRKINISTMLYQCDNFNQNAIDYKNLKGVLDADVNLKTVMNNELKLLAKELYAKAGLNIQNGELNNYEPLKGLSKFITVEELANVKFDQLKNTIEIKNEVVYIPQMEIKNSALDIVMGGEHHFDTYMSYHFNLKLNDILKKKYKNKRNKDNQEYEEEEVDGIRLFISMKGKSENIKFQYDNKRAMKNFKEDIKKEKSTFKELIKEEFKGKKKEEEKPKEPKKSNSWEDDIPD